MSGLDPEFGIKTIEIAEMNAHKKERALNERERLQFELIRVNFNIMER